MTAQDVQLIRAPQIDVVPQTMESLLQERVWIARLSGAPAMRKIAPNNPQLAQKSAAPVTTANRKTGSVRARAAALGSQHQRLVASLGPGAELLHSYRFAYNGFAVRMNGAQAAKLRAMRGVLSVVADAERKLATDTSPQFLELFDPDRGLVSNEGLSGTDVVIAIIDSGITPESESFGDERAADSPRACRSSWGMNSLLGRWLCTRYRRADAVSLFDPPEGWAGECEAGDQFAETDCNNKLIGARFYSAGALALGEFDDGEFLSPRDADGHGTHIASTAAGNRVRATLNGSEVATIRGIAPGARIAAYKACWLRPGATRATCAISDLVQAIDDAVADGADIINYSIGNTEETVANADDVALLEATKAGVLTIVAAGNDGPMLGSIGSPSSSPWALTVAAASRSGNLFVEASEVTTPPSLADRYPSAEALFTQPLSESGSISGSLILVDDGDETNDGSTSDACQAPINDSDLNGNIALITRGSCDFDDKIANAEDAGAIAAVVINNLGGPVIMSGDADGINIPAVSVGQADGQRFIDTLQDDVTVTIQLASGLFINETENGNLMGSFSSRGPALGAPDILKPDITAPGVNILAAVTPDVANGVSGQEFGYLTGTSMAAPHVAGAAALLKERHPNWTPAMLKSALMTSARQDILQSDGETDANPFDSGAGYMVPNDALDPGLVYATSNDAYDGFACGVVNFPITRTRCDQLSDSGVSDDPVNLNQPSIAVSRLTLSRTIRRTVTATRDGAWTAQLLLPAGFTGSVVPANLSLAAGESANVDITIGAANQALDLWYFGALEWQSDLETVRSPIAVRPVQIAAPPEVSAAGGTGDIEFDVRFGYTGDYSTQNYGLKPASVTTDFVANDITKQFTRRNDNGVVAFTLSVPANQLYLRLALFDADTDGNDDLDLYLYFCPTDTSCRRIGESGEASSNEAIDIAGPAAGQYEVYVHGFATDETSGGTGSNFDLSTWLIGPSDRDLNLDVDAPSFVSAGGTETLTAAWQNLATGQRYLGVVFHLGPAGLAALTLVSVSN
ncbi:MAG: S8 family serine peptidase [Woeseiaceae bacterium]